MNGNNLMIIYYLVFLVIQCLENLIYANQDND